MKTEGLDKQIRELFSKQRFAVIATYENNEPYTSLVAFSVTDDLSHLLFATLRQTRKYTNIKKNAKMSMLIDNRENLASDIDHTVAVTVLGKAHEIMEKRQNFVDIHLKKHPYLTKFVQNPNCALIGLSVKKFYVVQQFQQVTICDMINTR